MRFLHKLERGRFGFTLIEFSIVLAIVALMAAVGIGSLRNYLPRYRLVQTSKKLQNDLRALQTTAIERNRETRMLLVDADDSWHDPLSPSEGAWKFQVGNKSLNAKRWDTFPADADEDGTDDHQGEGSVVITRGGSDEAEWISLQPWDTLAGPGSVNTNAIVFSPRGWVTNPPEDFGEDGYITLTLINKRALSGGVTDSVDVQISRAGMIRLETSLGRAYGGGAAGTGTGSSL